MDAEPTIRRYRHGDRERVGEIMHAALRDAGALFEDVPSEDTADDYLASDREFLVAEMDGRIVGTGAFRPVGDIVTTHVDRVPDGALELKRMHVDPGYQRSGCGQRLLDELQQRTRDRGATNLLLYTSDRQTAALRFYEANGFEEVTRAPITAFEEPFQVVTFRKPLGE